MVCTLETRRLTLEKVDTTTHPLIEWQPLWLQKILNHPVMHVLRREALASLTTSRLFKGTYVWYITCNLLFSSLRPATHRSMGAETFPSFEVSEVDFFISHSWSCPGILKVLALCHELNLNLAVSSSILACLVSSFIIALEIRGSHVSADSQNFMFTWMKLFPVAVFLATYLFGHFFTKKTFWFDQISVSQGNLLLKSQTIQQIPSFIARSSRMLVLWDDSFFSRLWCNFELAVQCKVAPHDSIQIVPTWTPVWTLVLIGSQVFVCSFAARTPAMLTAEIDVAVDVYANALFAFIFSCFCFEKLKRHKSMLDKMASFDIRNAKCSLETDRIGIEEQVFQLFDEAVEPPVSVALDDLGAKPEPVFLETELPLISPDFHEVRHITSYPTKNEVMDQFNIYVRGPLRDAVLSSTGQPGYISFKLCAMAILPWFFAEMYLIVTCRGHHNCEAYALEKGYSSMALYLGVNAVIGLYLVNYVSVAGIPLMLRMNEVIEECVSHHILRILIGSCLGSIILYVLEILQQVQCGMLIVVSTQYSPVQLVYFLVGLFLEFALLWALFCRTPTRHRSHRHLALGST